MMELGNEAEASPTFRTIHTREEIRGLLRLKFRPTEICNQLGLSRSGFYRHLKAIKKEDMKYIESLRGSDFASPVRMTIESLEDIVRKLIIIESQAKNYSDKIKANELRYQIELDLLNVQRVGPSAVPLGTRTNKMRKLEDRGEE